MNIRLLIVYILGLGLLYQSFAHNKISFFKGSDEGITTKYIQKQHKKIRAEFKNPEAADLLVALTMGEKRWLDIKTRREFRSLGLTHLFTPSGLHLACCLYLFSFFKKRSKYEWIVLNILLCLFFIPGFFALKRILIIRYICTFFRKFTKWKIDLFHVFLFVFVVDYLFGSYELSPISHALSFIFVGSIYSLKNEITPRILTYNFLFLGLVINYFFEFPTSLIGSYLGIILTTIFSFIYPLFLLSFFTLKIPYEFILELLLSVVSLLSEFSRNFDYTTLTLPLFIFCFYAMIFHRKLNLKIMHILSLLLCFHSNPIVNLPHSIRHIKNLESDRPIRNLEIIKTSYSQNAIVIDYEKGVRCRVRIRNVDYYRKCKALKTKRPKSNLGLFLSN